MSAKPRSVLWIAAIIAACTVFGGLYGSRWGSAALATHKDAVEGEVQQLEGVLRVISGNYAEPIDPAEVIFDGAIPAMLRSLDPHSLFFDPGAFGRLREEQRGSYAGVGMLIQPFYGETIVSYPFPETPAFRAGIRPGDIIAKVDGVPMDNLSVDQVAEQVRGKVGTSVHLTLRRPGVDEPIEVDLVRADIPRSSVPLAYFVQPGVGYIKIKSFSETTAREVDEALEELQAKGLEALILDLRDNQGGLLTAGVRVADKFLERNQRIVSHRGRASDERVYRAKQGHGGELYPVVVLVNCHSASAAEIVAGALQDHDRALVAGSSTFGKGLVQSVFDLSHRAGLVLTTARYYTPSGRLIQRPYREVSQWDYYTGPCSQGYEPENSDPRLTDKGRPVFGGAGITPDVKLRELTPSDFQRRLAERRAYEGYAQQYGLTHDRLPPGWEPTTQTMKEFRAYLENQGISFTSNEFDQERAQISRLLMKAMYTALVDFDEGTRVYLERDPVVARAIELLREARALLESSTTQVADRR